MKDSLIIGFIVFLAKKIFEIYNDSFIDRAIKAVCDFFKNRAYNSSILGLFKTSENERKIWRNSITYKITSLPLTLIGAISKKCGDALSKMTGNSGILKIFDNLFYIPLNEYGALVLSVNIGMFLALVIKGGITKNALMFIVPMVIVGIILLLIPSTFSAIIHSSVILKPVTGLFDRYDLKDDENKSTRYTFHISGIKVFTVMFFIIGTIAGFTSPVATALALVASIAVLVIFHNTVWGIFLTVFLAVLMPTIVCAGLVALCAVSFLKDLLLNKDRKYIMTPIDFFVVAFLLIQVFSAITSCNVGKSIHTLLISVVFTLIYFLIVNNIKTKNQWYNLLLTFILSGFLISVIGIAQNFFVGTTTASWVDSEMFEDIGTRVYATLENPNVLGQYLVLVIPIAFALLWSAKKPGEKVAFSVVLVAMVLCLIFTWSRAAWIGVVLAIALYLVMKDRRWVALGILALIILPFVLPESIMSRLMSIGNMKDSSTAYRVSVWIASARIAIDYLLTGIGLGTGAFERVYPGYALNGAGFALHSHNFYLQLVVEMGIFALILFLLIIFSSYKQIVSVKEKNSVNKNVALAVGGALIGYMFEGMAEHVWYNYRMILIFWIYLAILQSGVKIAKDRRTAINSIKE